MPFVKMFDSYATSLIPAMGFCGQCVASKACNTLPAEERRAAFAHPSLFMPGVTPVSVQRTRLKTVEMEQCVEQGAL
jgi:hypothetical protein